MKYIERLQASDKELKASTAEARAAEVQSSLKAKIANQEARITRLKNQAENTLNRYPLDLDVVSSANAKVREASDELGDLQAVYDDLFPEG